jgi:VWFA-related protein
VRAACLLLASSVAVVSAQEAPRPRTVQIGVVVTDRAGRPLADLTPSDFELKAGGLLQPIQAVELRRTNPGEAGRVFGIFLDEFHVSPGASSEAVRRTLLQFMDVHVRPTDRVVVMKPLDSQLEIALTADRGVWRRAIETFDGRAGDYEPRTAFEEQYIGRAPALVETSRAQIVTSALRALVTRLGEASSGRAAVAFVSEGFATGGRFTRERRLPDFQSIVRVASRAGVPVYTVNPATGSAEAGSGDAVAARLAALATETGGVAGTSSELTSTLERMARDLDSYYVLTFTPSQKAEGHYYRLELTSTRSHAVVRAPSGFWTPAPPVVTDAAPPRPIRTLRRSAMIRTWYGVSQLADGRMRLRVTWEPAPRAAAVVRATGAPAAVVVRAARTGGDVLFEGKVPVGALAEMIVPPGRVELDLTIVAADGRALDREARDVDVPKAGAQPATALVPEIIRARTYREYQDAARNPGAVPTPTREFLRSDRLIVRAPAQVTERSALKVSARILNRWGQPMRDLEPLDGPHDAIVQFGLPLAWLVAGQYEIEVRTTRPEGVASQKIPLRVIG